MVQMTNYLKMVISELYYFDQIKGDFDVRASIIGVTWGGG